MLKEFRAFILRGNVIDLAVGIIIGLAFGQIVDSFVKDLLMPPIGLLLGGVDFTNLFINLSDRPLETLAQAKAAGAPTINYGVFLNTIINFLIIAFVLFLIVRQVNRMRTEPTPTTRPCPYCVSTIPINATRCPHCTSQLTAAS